MEQSTLTNSNFLENKKAQGWGLDVIAAIVIFMSGVIILYIYSINYVSDSQNNLDELLYQGNLAAELILGDDEWGIITNERVNQTKLNDFNTSYISRKANFGITNDFYFILEGLDPVEFPLGYIGKMNSTQIEDLIKITRVTIYKNKITKLELYIWKE